MAVSPLNRFKHASYREAINSFFPLTHRHAKIFVPPEKCNIGVDRVAYFLSGALPAKRRIGFVRGNNVEPAAGICQYEYFEARR